MTAILDTLDALAQKAMRAEPSDHGILSSTRMAMWVDALTAFENEATPERVRAMITVIRAGIVVRSDCFEHSYGVEEFDNALAELEKLA